MKELIKNEFYFKEVKDSMDRVIYSIYIVAEDKNLVYLGRFKKKDNNGIQQYEFCMDHNQSLDYEEFKYIGEAFDNIRNNKRIDWVRPKPTKYEEKSK